VVCVGPAELRPERRCTVNPVDDITPDWQFIHIGVEGDHVSIQGLNPWSTPNWRWVEAEIVVAHPSYPHQRHKMNVYEAESDNGSSVVFAAGEFSNGVWGFFVPG
jgi:hypothetical protein